MNLQDFKISGLGEACLVDMRDAAAYRQVTLRDLAEAMERLTPGQGLALRSTSRPHALIAALAAKGWQECAVWLGPRDWLTTFLR